MTRRALLLDLDGTRFRCGCEMMGRYGEREPAVRAVVARRGPLGPEPDALWEAMLREPCSSTTCPGTSRARAERA